MRRILLTVLTLMALIPAMQPAEARIAARYVTGQADVYAYSHALDAEDKLTDGPNGRVIRLASNTMLLWVDRMPGARFSHATVYVLISPHGTRVERGQWWPELNGRRILYGKRNPVSIASPVEVAGMGVTNPIEVFAYPEELTPQDMLTDGPQGARIPLRTRSLLVWVDLEPGARFTHGTVYLLVGTNGDVRAMDGGWWPELNGKRILYGNRATYGWQSPFRLR